MVTSHREISFCGNSNSTHREPVVACAFAGGGAVAVGGAVSRVEVEVVRAAGTARVELGGPVIVEVASVAEVRIPAVASGWEEQLRTSLFTF